MSNKITAIIPTFNEELNIESAIKSVDFADEIIVIDSYSTDNTVRLAKKKGVIIIQREFDTFSNQKNYAIDQAKNNWIYILDADERIPDKLRTEILDAVKNPKNNVGFYVYRTFYFMGKKIKYSGWQNNKVIRLFLKDNCRYNGASVHEKIIADGELGFFKNKLEHYSYRDLKHFISKSLNYKYIQAEQYNKEGKRSGLIHIAIKPLARFFIHYFFKLGFLDGFPGFVLALTQSFGVFIRYVKLWLLNKGLK